MAEEFDKLTGDGQEPSRKEYPSASPETEQEPLFAEKNDADEDSEDPPKRPGAELFEWLQMIMGCVLVAVLLFNCFARVSRVDGSSMDTTLQDGELMLVWSLGYEPKAGDIVVLNKTTADFLGNRAIVKRVIATGGQTVDIDYTAGIVYVDGQPLDEPYIMESMYRPDPNRHPTMQETHWDVPEGSIFVMGDNRNNSTDSRDIRLGTVDQDYVLGKVVLALWPLSKIGLM